MSRRSQRDVDLTPSQRLVGAGPERIASALAQAREEGRQEIIDSLRDELYRLAAVEVWARRIIGNALIWARDAEDELNKDLAEHGDHSTERTSLRHAAGHLQRLVEILKQPLPEEGTPDRDSLAHRVEELETPDAR